jgi:hypothetical protein
VVALANSLATVISDPDLYRLLTFHVPKLISLFRSWGRTTESVHVRGFVGCFVTSYFFYGEELLAPRPTPKLEDHPLSAVYDCLIHMFAVTLHNWRPILHPQPEDARCRGDRDPLNTDPSSTTPGKVETGLKFFMQCHKATIGGLY